MPDTDKKTIPAMSVDTLTLAKRLAKAEPGETIEYKELTGLIRSDVQGKSRHNLTAARNRVLNESQLVFSCVHGLGLKRLTDEEIPQEGHHATKRVRRISRKALRVLSTANREKMSKDAKQSLDLHASLHGMIQSASNPKRLEAVKREIGNGKIPPQDFSKLALGA